MASPVLQIRRGPAANIGLVTLRAGEPGFTNDRFEFYIGTGTTITLGINTITSELITAPNNKFFGASAYWSKETSTTGGGVNLLESTNNGDNYITLAAPNILDANVQYTFPGIITDGKFLKTNSTGVLSWSSDITDLNVNNLNVGFLTATNSVAFTSTTDSTDKDTGALIVEGGIGVEKSVNIGGNLRVAGVSTFIGEVRFEGGTINIGDNPDDDIIVGGEFASDVGPSTTTTYNLGSSEKRWNVVYAQDFNASGAGIFSGSIYAGAGADIVGKTELDDLVVSGVSTFQNGVFANDPGNGLYSLDAGGSARIGKDLYVTGISTLNGLIDANGALSVDGVTTLNSNLSVTGFSTFQNAAVLSSNLSVSGITTLSSSLSVSGITTVGGFLDANGGLDVLGHSELDSLNVTGVSTFTNDFNVTGPAIFTNTVTGTISTATRATLVDTTTAISDQEYFVTFVDDATGQTSETVRVSYGASFNPSTRTFSVDNIKTSAVKAKDGTSAITLTNSTGAVGVSSDLTVSGNLYVLGVSAEVNTETLKVEDSLIEVGLVNSGGFLGAPTGDLNIDVGIIMHWYQSGAKKAAAFWDDSASRIVLASDVSETSSVISVNTYSGLEIGNLWVNDVVGQSEVISVDTGVRVLNNITIDGGSF